MNTSMTLIGGQSVRALEAASAGLVQVTRQICVAPLSIQLPSLVAVRERMVATLRAFDVTLQGSTVTSAGLASTAGIASIQGTAVSPNGHGTPNVPDSNGTAVFTTAADLDAQGHFGADLAPGRGNATGNLSPRNIAERSSTS